MRRAAEMGWAVAWGLVVLLASPGPAAAPPATAAVGAPGAGVRGTGAGRPPTGRGVRPRRRVARLDPARAATPAPDGERVELLRGRSRAGWVTVEGRSDGDRVEVWRGRADAPPDEQGFGPSAPVPLLDEADAAPAFGPALGGAGPWDRRGGWPVGLFRRPWRAGPGAWGPPPRPGRPIAGLRGHPEPPPR